jgi:hypothetical protein
MILLVLRYVANVIKLFMAVIYARAYVPGKPYPQTLD